MRSQDVLTETEKTVLVRVLEAGNYKLGNVDVSRSQLMDGLGLDTGGLVSALRSLSNRGLIRLNRLPSDIEDALVTQLRGDIDALDLIYLENNLDESEYVRSREVLVSELKPFPSKVEPLSPLEAARLFLTKDLVIEQVLRSTESIQQWQVPENLSNELVLARDGLLPFRGVILSRISDLASAGDRRQDHSDEKRMRMLILFSQVGLSGLVPLSDVADDLLDKLELLRARHLVGEVSESDLDSEAQNLRQEILKRMKPILPDQEAFRKWKQHLGRRLDGVKSSHDKVAMTDDLFNLILGDLNEDIALLDAHVT